MKKAFIIFFFVLVLIFGIVLLNDGKSWYGIFAIAISLYFLNYILSRLEKNGKPVFYNPHLTKNRLVINSGFQMFESFVIISETKVLKTLSSRINFINTRYDYFISSSKEIAHFHNIEYSTKLHNQKTGKSVDEIHINLLVNPDRKDLNKFFASCIVVSYSNYVKKEVIGMDSLKRESAIQKRKIKVSDMADSYKELLETIDVNNRKDYANKIDEIGSVVSLM